MTILCLLEQQQKKLLDLKINNTRNRQKIELYGSLTTKDVKKSHLSRRVAGAEMQNGQKGIETPCGVERWQRQNGWSYIHLWWIKIRRDTFGVNNPSLRLDHTAQDSRARKINPYNSCLKTSGVGVVEETAGFSGDST